MMPVAASASAAGTLIHDALQKASFVLVALGAVMLVRERARYSKRLRMSKQEIRDERRKRTAIRRSRRASAASSGICAART